MSYSVILPTYNEKGHIVSLIIQITKIFKKVNKKFEIIVVDDNSTDGTANQIKKYILKKKNIFLINRKKKRNLAQSINEGIFKSKHKYIIWMDADFQHPPKYIKEFIKKTKFHDVIVCSRFLKHSKRYFQTNKNKKKDLNENQSLVYNKICRFFLFKDFTDYTSGFICIKKSLLKMQLKGFYGDYFLNLICSLKLKKIKILEIPFNDSPRISGKSKTLVMFNANYIYTCFRYFLTLIKNIFNVNLWKL